MQRQIILMNSKFFPLFVVEPFIIPVLVSYILVLHFMLCLISNNTRLLFGKVIALGSLGQKACSEKRHPFPCFILPSIILMCCFLCTPFVTTAAFQHEGVY